VNAPSPSLRSSEPPRTESSAAGAELRARIGMLAAAIAQVPPPHREALQRELAQLTALVDNDDEARAFSNFLQTHLEREKALLARELHDSLGGILTPAKMDLAWLEARLADDPEYGARVRRLSALIDQGIDLKRRIIENLRPSLLDHLGLASALQWYVEETCRDANIESQILFEDGLERLSPDMEIALYRLVQDGLNNTVRHAHAQTFELRMQRTLEGLQLEMADDGVGIADVAKARHLHHGLVGMSHRVHSVNGTFEIRSEPGKGTRIKVFVPLRPRT
jgi:signal transduction histidine kinase